MKTTKTQYRFFQKRCIHWMHTLGIKDWDVAFCHIGLDGAWATTAREPKNRGATISFCNDAPIEPQPMTDEVIDQCALHEVLHLLLGDMVDFHEEHATRDRREAIDTIEHRVIRTLENFVFKKL